MVPVLKEGEYDFGNEIKNGNYIVETYSKDVPIWKIEENLARGARIEDRGDGRWTVVIPNDKTYNELLEDKMLEDGMLENKGGRNR